MEEALAELDVTVVLSSVLSVLGKCKGPPFGTGVGQDTVRGEEPLAPQEAKTEAGNRRAGRARPERPCGVGGAAVGPS